jgi:hypothetical protein
MITLMKIVAIVGGLFTLFFISMYLIGSTHDVLGITTLLKNPEDWDKVVEGFIHGFVWSLVSTIILEIFLVIFDFISRSNN